VPRARPKPKPDNPVRQAVEALGGVGAAARLLKVRERTIERWRKAGRIADARACFLVERETGIAASKLAGVNWTAPSGLSKTKD
jgi:DNA-binding transcriptional regulator YdaS (Cro superfamily)